MLIYSLTLVCRFPFPFRSFPLSLVKRINKWEKRRREIWISPSRRRWWARWTLGRATAAASVLVGWVKGPGRPRSKRGRRARPRRCHPIWRSYHLYFSHPRRRKREKDKGQVEKWHTKWNNNCYYYRVTEICRNYHNMVIMFTFASSTTGSIK